MHWRDFETAVREFWSSGDSSSSSIEDEWNTIRLRGRNNKKKRVAIVKSRIHNRSGSGDSSVMMAKAPNVAIWSMRERTFTLSGGMLRHKHTRIKDDIKITSSRYRRYKKVRIDMRDRIRYNIKLFRKTQCEGI
jgi:hypothetical protein